MILCDAGVLFCLVDRSQPKHLSFIQLVNTLPKPLVTSWPCFTEAMYLALKRGGWRMQEKLAELIVSQILYIYEIRTDKYQQLFGLMKTYRDTPMDLADATLVLIAESTSEKRILTLDSDFYVYRIHGKDAFEILH